MERATNPLDQITVHSANRITVVLIVHFHRQKDGLTYNKIINVLNVSNQAIGQVLVMLNLAGDATDHIIHSSASEAQQGRCWIHVLTTILPLRIAEDT